MKHYINKLTIVALLLAGSVYAQQNTNYTLYRYTMNVVNPAYAGADGNTHLTANIRSQWEEVQDAPETQSFIFAAPIGDRIGLGATIVSDETFIERETSLFVDFSYRLPVTDNTNVFLGLKAGGSTYNIDQSGLANIGLPTDPAIGNIDTGFRPNIGIGAYLHNEKYFLSLSSPNLLSSKRVTNDNGVVTSSNNKAHFYLSGGYNLSLGTNTEFKPSVMVRGVSGAPISTDITAAFKFFQKFEVGAIYRTDKALGGLAFIDVADWMAVGYAYESSLRGELNSVNDGTHEILIRFNFGNKSDTKSMVGN